MIHAPRQTTKNWRRPKVAWSDPGHDPDGAVIWGQAGKNSNGPHKSDIRNLNRGILASNAYFYGPSAPPSMLHTAFVDAGFWLVSINIKWPLIGQDGQRQESGYKEINTLCLNTLLSLGSALDILTSFLTILTFTSTLDTCHKLVSECVGDALWEIMLTK